MISKITDRCFLFFSITILLTILIWIPSAFAQEHGEEENRFDGSEFNISSFRDTNFEKRDYKELSSQKSAGDHLSKANDELSLKESSILSRKRKNDKGINAVGGENEGPLNAEKGPLKAGGERKIGADPGGPVTDLPGDWVPDRIKLTNNGGFSIEPDNGSPVPYRLNGHVDIQRGRP